MIFEIIGLNVFMWTIFVIIGFDNGLVPVQHQAIVKTNDDLL